MVLFPCFHRTQQVTPHLNPEDQSNEQYHPYLGPGTNRSRYLLPNFDGTVSFIKQVDYTIYIYIFSPGQSNPKHIPVFPCFQILIYTVQTHTK